MLGAKGVTRILEAAPGPGPGYRAAFSVAYGGGLRASEVTHLKIGDIVPEARLRHDIVPEARLRHDIVPEARLRHDIVPEAHLRHDDSDRMLIRIDQGKSRKDRHVMLSPSLLVRLRDHCPEARPAGWLFPNRNRVDPISTRQFNRAFGMACDFARIKKRVLPHTLRHSFDTHPLEEGTDIRVIHDPAVDTQYRREGRGCRAMPS